MNRNIKQRQKKQSQDRHHKAEYIHGSGPLTPQVEKSSQMQVHPKEEPGDK
jgi:hypothetical protein